MAASSSTATGINPGNSRYALPPCDKASLLSVDERLAKIQHLIEGYGSECIDVSEIRALFEKSSAPVAYDGFEPSGRMHIAQGLMKRHFVNALTESGFTYAHFFFFFLKCRLSFPPPLSRLIFFCSTFEVICFGLLIGLQC